MRLAGIDLAWKSEKNTSAIAVGDLEAGILTVRRIEPAVRGLESVRSVIAQEPDLFGIAIDAPLIITNSTGQRSCETELSKAYWKRKISCHTTNLTRYPEASSVKLSTYLENHGFRHLCPRSCGHFQIESYPHPAVCEIFNLSERLSYKKGNVEAKRNGQVALGELIKGLSGAAPALLFDEHLNELVRSSRIRTLTGISLKTNEDALDSVICLYIAALFAGSAPSRVYGTVQKGYIYVPKGENQKHDEKC